MAPKSKIEKLPDDVKAFIDKSLKENRLTQMEITQRACEMLEKRGYDEETIFSVMSLNRYSKVYFHMIKTRREAEQMYKMLSEENPENGFDINDAIVAQTKNLVAREMQKIASGEVEFDAEHVSKLTLISKRLSETEQKVKSIRTQAVKEYREELARKLDNIESQNPKRMGLSKEAVNMLKRDLLGVPIDDKQLPKED